LTLKNAINVKNAQRDAATIIIPKTGATFVAWPLQGRNTFAVGAMTLRVLKVALRTLLKKGPTIC
jgi:hypothetical protein